MALGRLALGPDGNFYGTTGGLLVGDNIIFKVTPSEPLRRSCVRCGAQSSYQKRQVILPKTLRAVRVWNMRSSWNSVCSAVRGVTRGISESAKRQAMVLGRGGSLFPGAGELHVDRHSRARESFFQFAGQQSCGGGDSNS